MEAGEQNTLFYKRSHFVTRLPMDRLYSRSHYWLRADEGVWQVGLTKFATRMLGEIVDYGFEVQEGATVEPGKALGWIEGFKAISDVFSVISGKFAGANPQLTSNPEAIDRDCYGLGWFYKATGEPDATCMNAQGYKELLDTTIDKLVEKQEHPD